MRDTVQLRVYCHLYKPVSSTIILIDKSLLYLPVKEKKSTTINILNLTKIKRKFPPITMNFKHTFTPFTLLQVKEITPTEATETKLELKKKIKKRTAGKILTQDGQDSAALMY